MKKFSKNSRTIVFNLFQILSNNEIISIQIRAIYSQSIKHVLADSELPVPHAACGNPRPSMRAVAGMASGGRARSGAGGAAAA
jgi:hypothetical protein